MSQVVNTASEICTASIVTIERHTFFRNVGAVYKTTPHCNLECHILKSLVQNFKKIIRRVNVVREAQMFVINLNTIISDKATKQNTHLC
jgi:hypothetical protein